MFYIYCFFFFTFAYSSNSDKAVCVDQGCKVLITHFYFSNTGRKPYIKVDFLSNNNSIYFNKIISFLNQQYQEIVKEKKNFFEWFKRKETIIDEREKAILSTANTYLILEELFNNTNTEIKNLKIMILKQSEDYIRNLINEIFSHLDQITKDIFEKWLTQSLTNPENFSLGFSLVPHKKTFLQKIPFWNNKVNHNGLFNMTIIFKTIFNKINILMYWYYLLQKMCTEDEIKNKTYTINNEKLYLPSVFQKINDELDEFHKALEQYFNLINANIIANSEIKVNNKKTFEYELLVVKFFQKIIQSSRDSIGKTIAKNKAKTPQDKAQKVLCFCPYVQLDFSTFPQLEPFEKLTTHMQTNILQSKKLNDPIVNDPIVSEFLQLNMITRNNKNKYDNTVKLLIEKKEEAIIKKCTLIENHIKKWCHQLKDEKNGSWLTRKINYLKNQYYIKSNYFFGFSLIVKRFNMNRYSYMINNIATIFEDINEILLFNSANNNKLIKNFIVKLEDIINAFEEYKNHFKENNITHFEINPSKEDFLVTIASNTQDKNILQIGIEIIILQKISEWIKNNIAILHNKKTKDDDSSDDESSTYYDLEDEFT